LHAVEHPPTPAAQRVVEVPAIRAAAASDR